MKNLNVPDEVTLDGRTMTVENGRVDLAGQKLKVGGKTLDIAGKTTYVKDGVLYINGQAQKDTRDTYGFMIRELLPPGLRGVLAAALLAALMGTVSGALNSTATLFSYDLFKRWKPDIGEHQLVLIGRVVTFVAMIAAILWSPWLGRFESIFQGIIAMICYIAPPITAVFLWGVLWRRASSLAAQLTLYIGSALGLAVFLLDWFKDYTGWNVPFMMAAFYLFAACSVILVVVSLVAPHRHTAESQRLVWSNPLDSLRAPNAWRGLGDFRFLAGLLFVVMVVLYVIFA
jgi:SSS family solute:Na+ symporter